MSSDKKHPDKPLEDLRKAHEEEFFHKQNLENIKKMKAHLLGCYPVKWFYLAR